MIEEPAAEPEVEPLPDVPTGTNPLTGLPIEPEYEQRRPVAVMLNNLKKAQPQLGNSQADIIYEVPAEGGITRMLAVYQSLEDVGSIGSIRSARPYYIELALGHDALYVHAGGSPEDMDAPAAFRQSTRLSQHISFLRDFFRSYKSFTDRQIDVIEIMVGRLYERWRISDSTDFSRLTPEDYPILSDLYALIEQEYRNFDEGKYQLYTAAILQEILLGLHSMCKGAESKFFNGHTNVTSSRFVVFGVKGLLQASKNVRSAMLFNVLSYLSDKLLTEGNTVAALDELYIWLSDNVAVGTTIIEYIRNCLKRVRKKESAMLLASQNLEDFNQEGIRELTKPLFAIPPHQFLFNAGAVDKKFYMEALQLEESEYNLIRFPQRGVCLYRCGNERYLLEVHAPAYKEALFGKAGGR